MNNKLANLLIEELIQQSKKINKSCCLGYYYCDCHNKIYGNHSGEDYIDIKNLITKGCKTLYNKHIDDIILVEEAFNILCYVQKIIKLYIFV